MSSGNCGTWWKSKRLCLELIVLEAVVQAPEEPVEEVALSSSVSGARESAPVVVSSSASGWAYRGEGPQIADCGQPVVLVRAMKDGQFSFRWRE